MATTVAVIIPYYQRDPGILSTALQSVFAQQLPSGVRMVIYVVDDASPLPSETEIGTLTVPAGIELVVLKRENGGPGAARNTALDALAGAAIDYVAFLDSDDQWMPTHIRHGLAALAGAASFYFCDHTRMGFVGSLFTSELSTINAWKNSATPVTSPIPEVPDTFEISGKLVFDGMLVEYLSQTSTVIFNVRTHPAVRFNESLRNAGEDGFFWLELAAASQRVAVSIKTNVRCGTGVNIYFGSFDWNSNNSVARYGYLILYRLHILKSFVLHGANSAMVHQQLEATTNAYAYLMMRQLARGTPPDLKLLAELARKDPGRMALLPIHFWRGLRNRKKAANLW